MLDSFFSALTHLDNSIAEILKKIENKYIGNIQEIRLRAGLPLTIYINNNPFFVNSNGCVITDYKNSVTVKKESIAESVRKITGKSLYSHLDEISNGFISMPYGNRAGICGVFKQGKFCEPTSVNIRIAHQLKGIAENIINNYSGGSVLICGPPSSGKTTFLRDLIRGLSNGENGKFYKVSLIDTRSEIAAVSSGIALHDIGINTDVFVGREKAEGIEAAVRSMSPEIVAFDEIGTIAELNAIKNSINCGAYIITTAHIGDVTELHKRDVTRSLLQDCEIKQVIFLKYAGSAPIIYNVRNGEICYCSKY